MRIEGGHAEGLSVYAHTTGKYGGNGTVREKLSDKELKKLGYRNVPIDNYAYAEFVARTLKGKILVDERMVYKNSRQRRLEKKRRRLRGAFMKITMKGIDVFDDPKVRNALVKEMLKDNRVKSIKHIKENEIMFEVLPKMNDQGSVDKIMNTILEIEIEDPKTKKKKKVIEPKSDYNFECAD